MAGTFSLSEPTIDPPPALTAIEGSSGHGRWPRGDRGGKSLTWMRTPRLPLQPAPPSGGCTSRPAGRVRSRPSWASGRPRARPGLWLRLPERRFPAASELGQWVRERLQTGEWDDLLCSLRACLPRAPPGLLERRLLQFLEWAREAARDLRQPDFLRVLAVALSSFSPEVWESLLHDSTSPKLLMQRIREEVLARGLGVVGRVDIPREVWDSCCAGLLRGLGGQAVFWDSTPVG